MKYVFIKPSQSDFVRYTSLNSAFQGTIKKNVLVELEFVIEGSVNNYGIDRLAETQKDYFNVHFHH